MGDKNKINRKKFLLPLTSELFIMLIYGDKFVRRNAENCFDEISLATAVIWDV